MKTKKELLIGCVEDVMDELENQTGYSIGQQELHTYLMNMPQYELTELGLRTIKEVHDKFASVFQSEPDLVSLDKNDQIFDPYEAQKFEGLFAAWFITMEYIFSINCGYPVGIDWEKEYLKDRSLSNIQESDISPETVCLV